MHRLHLLGLNHTTAPLHVREKLAFGPSQLGEATAEFRRRFPDAETVLLSTCNRVELYTARHNHGHPRAEDVAGFLADFHGLTVDSFRPHLYHRSERGMVEHLFEVACSLDSMVLGETQILGQVRGAYEAAKRAGAVGPLLNPLFQKAVAVGKQVIARTGLSDGRVSVATVAVDHARRIFDHFDDKTVLGIGAGKMSRLVLRSFAAVRPGRLLVCNRDQTRAAALAAETGATAIPFDLLDDQLAAVDVVVTSTGSSDAILTAARFAAVHKRRRYRPLFIIDIALPRDVDPAVGEFDNVYLYNLDDLQRAVAGTQSTRQTAVDPARAIVTAAVDEFVAAHRARQMGPAIDKLFKRSHELAQAEVARTLNKLPSITADEKAVVEELARRIVNKLLHDPVQAVRAADPSHASPDQYLHALEQMFKLKGP